MKRSKPLPSRRAEDRSSLTPQERRRSVLRLLPGALLHLVPSRYPDDPVTDPSKGDPTTRGATGVTAALANLDLRRGRFYVDQLDRIEETNAGRLDGGRGTTALARRREVEFEGDCFDVFNAPHGSCRFAQLSRYTAKHLTVTRSVTVSPVSSRRFQSCKLLPEPANVAGILKRLKTGSVRKPRLNGQGHNARSRDSLRDLVPGPGIEPGRPLGPRDFKSRASASSATPAHLCVQEFTASLAPPTRCFSAYCHDSVLIPRPRAFPELSALSFSFQRSASVLVVSAALVARPRSEWIC